jgi:hypothetical protein
MRMFMVADSGGAVKASLDEARVAMRALAATR